jgi:hypothetical protein
MSDIEQTSAKLVKKLATIHKLGECAKMQYLRNIQQISVIVLNKLANILG